MADIRFLWDHEFGTMRQADLELAMRIRVAQSVAEAGGYEFDDESDEPHEHEYRVAVPDEDVPTLLDKLLAAGAIPFDIRFTTKRKGKAKRLASFVWEHTTGSGLACARVWLTWQHACGTLTESEICHAMAMHHAAGAVRGLGYTVKPCSESGHYHDYYVDLPDRVVPELLEGLLTAGIVPGTIDFATTDGARAKRLATVRFDHEIGSSREAAQSRW